MKTNLSYQNILAFWFEELSPNQWFTKDASLDRVIRDRFLATYKAASCCECVSWRDKPKGRLAEIIVLDQFPRSMFRDTPASFLYDPLALALTQEAIALGVDKAFTPDERSFLYMPIMHSESLTIHNTYLDLFKNNTPENTYSYELKHKEIIEQFNRYPHRNAILGRTSTAEEIEFLKQPGSSF